MISPPKTEMQCSFPCRWRTAELQHYNTLYRPSRPCMWRSLFESGLNLQSGVNRVCVGTSAVRYRRCVFCRRMRQRQLDIKGFNMNVTAEAAPGREGVQATALQLHPAGCCCVCPPRAHTRASCGHPTPPSSCIHLSHTWQPRSDSPELSIPEGYFTRLWEAGGSLTCYISRGRQQHVYERLRGKKVDTHHLVGRSLVCTKGLLLQNSASEDRQSRWWQEELLLLPLLPSCWWCRREGAAAGGAAPPQPGVIWLGHGRVPAA